MPPQYTDLEPSSDTLIPDAAPPQPTASATNAGPSSVSVLPMRPRYSAPERKILPDLTLENAYKTLQFFQDNPRYLANPYTRNAAESVFGAATKVVGINIQLERLNAKAESARAQSATAGMVGKSLLKLAEGGGEGAKWAAQWYAPGNDGKAKYEDPSNWAQILTGYETNIVKEIAKDNRPVADTLTFADGKTVNVVYGPSGAPTVIKDGKEADDTYMKALQEVAKADLLDARKAVHKATGVDEREQALNGYYSAKRNFDSVFRTSKPATAPATNAPAATTNAPAASSAIPMPSAKTELVPGTRYSTPRGEATWDGEKFVK